MQHLFELPLSPMCVHIIKRVSSQMIHSVQVTHFSVAQGSLDERCYNCKELMIVIFRLDPQAQLCGNRGGDIMSVSSTLPPFPRVVSSSPEEEISFFAPGRGEILWYAGGQTRSVHNGLFRPYNLLSVNNMESIPNSHQKLCTVM